MKFIYKSAFYAHGLDVWSNPWVVGPFPTEAEAILYNATLPPQFDKYVITGELLQKNVDEFGPIEIEDPKQ